MVMELVVNTCKIMLRVCCAWLLLVVAEGNACKASSSDFEDGSELTPAVWSMRNTEHAIEDSKLLARSTAESMLQAAAEAHNDYGDSWGITSATQADSARLVFDVQSKQTLLQKLAADQFNFYGRDSLVNIAVIMGLGATIANTKIDSEIHRHFQNSVRRSGSDEIFEFLHANKELGNGMYTLPIMGIAWATELWDGPPALRPLGTWGERSLRGFLVGAPPVIIAQRLTGASRPGENREGSQWHPLQDNNGVSGHAFMSALPFITAAKLTDEPWLKVFWYGASTIGPLSRVNDGAHYPSQIGMGWALAFVAASAVAHTDGDPHRWSLYPQSVAGDLGFAVEYRY